MQWSNSIHSNRQAEWIMQAFQSHVEAVDHLNGDLGVHMLYIQAQIQDAGSDPDDVAVWEQISVMSLWQSIFAQV
jgi:hypothetical protein